MKCKICGQRKPRRYCPGVQGDICSICCGNEREVTVQCPFDCVYLREARLREKPKEEPAEIPNADIDVPQRFLREHEKLAMDLLLTIYEAAMRTPGTVDFDVRTAIEALIRTYRTQQSGLYYESRPDDRIAAAVYDAAREFLDRTAREAREKSMSIRDSEILGLLVFVQRLELRDNNGRKRGRAFLDSVRASFAPEGLEQPGAPPPPLLIVP